MLRAINAEFMHGSCKFLQDFVSSSQLSILRDLGHGCPPGVPLVECLVDPCRSATCPAHPHAVCVADYCGGCNAKFFDRDGKEVTSSCNLKAY